MVCYKESNNIICRRVDSNTKTVSTDLSVDSSGNTQTHPSLAKLTTNKIIIAYTDESGDNIRYKLINESGTTVTNIASLANSITSGN